MSATIGMLLVDELLEEITDYDLLELSESELNSLYDTCKYMKDVNEIEREINIFLQSLGHEYNDFDNVWER